MCLSTMFCAATNYSEISIGTELFKYGFSLFSKLYDYRVSLSVHTPARAVGQSEMAIHLNPPPSGGQCSMRSHTQPVNMDTKWTIGCVGWNDSDGIDSFNFYSEYWTLTVAWILYIFCYGNKFPKKMAGCSVFALDGQKIICIQMLLSCFYRCYVFFIRTITCIIDYTTYVEGRKIKIK